MDIKTKIIKEVNELFKKYGVKNITMDQISKQLGISKRTIYENFKDKDKIIKEILNDFSNNHEAKIIDILKNSENVIESLHQIFLYNMKTFSCINPLFFDDIKKYHNKIYEEFKTSHKKIRNYTLTTELLEKGIEQKIFLKNIKIDIAIKILDNLIDLMANTDNELKEKYSKHELYSGILLTFLRGISTKKGIKIIELHAPDLFSEEA